MSKKIIKKYKSEWEFDRDLAIMNSKCYYIRDLKKVGNILIAEYWFINRRRRLQ